MTSDAWILIGVVGAVLAVMLGVGIASRRFVTDADDFHRGGGRVPWWAAGTSIYMGAFSALAFVSYGSVVVSDGVIGILVGYGVAMGLVVSGLWFAKLWHRSALATPVEYLERRFGPGARDFVAYVTLVVNALSSALRLYAFALLLHGLTGAPVVTTILIAGVIMAAVATVGGLWGIVLADAVQFVVLLIGLVPLLILSLLRLGGGDGMQEFLTSGVFSFDRGERDLGWLLTWWLFQIVTGQSAFSTIQRFCSVPTEKDARKAAYLAAALLVPTPFLAMIPVAVGVYLFPSVEPEMAFANIAREVLPIGLLGLMVGSMIAATVSELESAFNVDSGVFTRMIYQRRIRPQATEDHLLAVARLSTLGSAAIAIILALIIEASRAGIFNISEAISSRLLGGVVFAFIAGLIVRRLSQAGFFLIVLFSGVVSAVLWALGWSSGDVRLPVMGAALAALIVGVLVLPQRGDEAKRVAEFFGELDRPRPAPSGVAVVDLRTVRLVGVTIVLMALIPLTLPGVAASTGAARIVEYAMGTTLALFGTLLLVLADRASRKLYLATPTGKGTST